MKFENVKVGDTVFTEKIVRYNWSSSRTFFIPEKVTRITKTQFVVESGDRYKKEGYKIGDRFTSAYLLGDYSSWAGLNKKLVSDETKELEDFKLKLWLENRFNKMSENMSVEKNSKLSIEDLKNIIAKLKAIEKILSKNN